MSDNNEIEVGPVPEISEAVMSKARTLIRSERVSKIAETGWQVKDYVVTVRWDEGRFITAACTCEFGKRNPGALRCSHIVSALMMEGVLKQ